MTKVSGYSQSHDCIQSYHAKNEEGSSTNLLAQKKQVPHRLKASAERTHLGCVHDGLAAGLGHSARRAN